MSRECGFDYPKGIGCWFGNFASLCFLIVYIPQFYLNWKRKSVKGLSLNSIGIKLIGSSFLFINSVFKGNAFPIFLYGFLNTLQHIGFIFQFYYYDHNKRCLLFCFVPLIPYLICKLFPFLIPYTDLIKPFCQIFSHIPQLFQCIHLHTTNGISMIGQHLNFLGCIFGFCMCSILDILDLKTWLIYFNSGFQAITIYMLAFWYHEMRLFDHKIKYRSPIEDHFYEQL